MEMHMHGRHLPRWAKKQMEPCVALWSSRGSVSLSGSWESGEFENSPRYPGQPSPLSCSWSCSGRGHPSFFPTSGISLCFPFCSRVCLAGLRRYGNHWLAGEPEKVRHKLEKAGAPWSCPKALQFGVGKAGPDYWACRSRG